MRIEPATPADLDALVELELHAFPRPQSRAQLAAELTRPNAHVDVVRAPDVIAYCSSWLVPDPGGAGEVHILSIATHPDRRRAGAGTALLRHALARARAAGCTLATLEVRRGNAAAIALYQAHGFQTVHTRRAYYQDNGEDALVMISAWSP
jgi:ribosomal-protein-alanine N-acetyltransferase